MLKCCSTQLIRTASRRTTTTTRIMPLRPLLTISSAISDALKKEGVFEDVLPEFEPKGLLQVSYGGSNEVAMGNTLKVADTQTKPKFQFTLNTPSSSSSSEDVVEIKETDKFALVLTDPDAPSRSDKKWSEFAHFITTDIMLKEPSQDGEFFSTEIDLGAQGKEILEYMGPGPPEGTGKHRYVFLLLKQTPGVSPEAPSDRPNWGTGKPGVGVLDWSTKYKLTPYAVNFFYAQNEKQ